MHVGDANDQSNGKAGDDHAGDRAANEHSDGSTSKDAMSGGAGKDRIVAGLGDKIDGGGGKDRLDLSEIGGGHNGGRIDVTGGSASFGSDTVQFKNMEMIVGSEGDDTFSFNSAKNGDHFHVDGGSGNNSVDLSRVSVDNITVKSDKIIVNQPAETDQWGRELSGSTRFVIHAKNIDSIVAAGGKTIDIGHDEDQESNGKKGKSDHEQPSNRDHDRGHGKRGGDEPAKHESPKRPSQW